MPELPELAEIVPLYVKKTKKKEKKREEKRERERKGNRMRNVHGTVSTPAWRL